MEIKSYTFKFRCRSGLAKYLEAFDKVLDWGKRNIRPNVTIGSGDMFAQREYLRRYVQDVLLREHPDFYHLWVNILSRQLKKILLQRKTLS